MKSATVQVSVQVSYDDTQLSAKDVQAALAERATAFLYPAGIAVLSATAKVKGSRR